MEDHPAPPKIAISWIQEILDQNDWSATELARKSSLAPSTILRMMNDPNHRFTPSLTTLRKIASAANAELPAELMAGRQDFDAAEDAADTHKGSMAVKVFHQATRPDTMELRRVSSLPAALQPAYKAGATVARPPHLAGDETAFAFWMPSGDLEPWVPAGSLVYASQRRDPKEGDLAVITRKDGRTSVRLVTSSSNTGLTLRDSSGDASDETVDFDDMQQLQVVLGWVRD